MERKFRLRSYEGSSSGASVLGLLFETLSMLIPLQRPMQNFVYSHNVFVSFPNPNPSRPMFMSFFSRRTAVFDLNSMSFPPRRLYKRENSGQIAQRDPVRQEDGYHILHLRIKETKKYGFYLWGCRLDGWCVRTRRTLIG